MRWLRNSKRRKERGLHRGLNQLNKRRSNLKRELMKSNQQVDGYQILLWQHILENLHSILMEMVMWNQLWEEQSMDSTCFHITLIHRVETIIQNTNNAMEELLLEHIIQFLKCIARVQLRIGVKGYLIYQTKWGKISD